MSLVYPDLREHQILAYNSVVEHAVKGVKRAIVMAPCSFGKTILAAFIACRAMDKGNRLLFLVDNIELVGQTIGAFDKAGLSIGVMQGNHPRKDRFAPIQIATNQTITNRIAKNPKYFEENPFSVVIVDEAHCRYKALNEVAVLNPSAVYIGLTATPWARGMGLFWETIISTIDVSELLDKGWLTPVDVYTHPCPSWAKVKLSAGDYAMAECAKQYTPYLMGNYLKIWEEVCADLSTIIFACDRAHARAMADTFQDAGYNFVCIDGATDKDEREELFTGFKNGTIQGVSTCQIAIKGFDATIAQCMLDVQPTRSMMRHYQKLGRIQRIHPGKDRSVVLDCAGNFIRNGLPTDELPKTLNCADPKSSSATDVRKQDDPLPQHCSKCKLLRPANVAKCPNCGHQPTPMAQRKHQEGVLQLLTGDPRVAKRLPKLQSEQQRWYSHILLHASLNGYKPGWAKHAFIYRFKTSPPPKTKKAKGVQGGADVHQWCDNYRRRRAAEYAKSKQAGNFGRALR